VIQEIANAERISKNSGVEIEKKEGTSFLSSKQHSNKK
jgi:hypothetical protein